ncbi:hypothetical protein KFK09_025698 [Dendrobium nobile]|uniref:Uncharacterized protein n=1 Tax=Dendrobium nobile TaxID=94219 RepID=A0A8T3A5M9_DENNO|nr:hypothetical protein KFK09_025698 [Dendrobium nobile]
MLKEALMNRGADSLKAIHLDALPYRKFDGSKLAAIQWAAMSLLQQVQGMEPLGGKKLGLSHLFKDR